MTKIRWRQVALDTLSDPDYKRFLRMRDISDLMIASGGPAWTPGDELSSRAYQFARELCGARDLIKIKRDLYANLRTRPVPAPAEAAHLLREGAVVSLQTVLGSAGIANNPTNVVYALYPQDERPGLRRTIKSAASDDGMALEFGVFRFIGVKRDYLEAGAAEDRLAASSYPTATPERALIDWIRLSQIKVSKFPPPPFDLDMDLLDRKRLVRVAKSTGMEQPFEEWLAAKVETDDAPDEGYSLPGVGR